MVGLALKYTAFRSALYRLWVFPGRRRGVSVVVADPALSRSEVLVP
jgi:hypothetical protein